MLLILLFLAILTLAHAFTHNPLPSHHSRRWMQSYSIIHRLPHHYSQYYSRSPSYSSSSLTMATTSQDMLGLDDRSRKFIEDTLKDILERMIDKEADSLSSHDDISPLADTHIDKIIPPPLSPVFNNSRDKNRGVSNSLTSSMNEDELLNSVIRVYCTHSEPNFNMPWQRVKQESSSSSGFVIINAQKTNDNGSKPKSYIITNAHSVEYGSIIQVKKRQSEKKYLAKALAVGYECDLAVLDVEDASFWNDIQPLQLGPNLPDLLEDVSVIGYPVGGDSISITSGVVSRIEMQEYAQVNAELLAIQIDAAINPGNSGGPVVNRYGHVIGVAFQSLSDEEVENIGYVVPVNVISHFLEDVERHGEYSGVCSLGLRLQAMENGNLRKYYGMMEADTGVVVSMVYPLAPAMKVLKSGDVILEIDGIRIANDGTIAFREGRFAERVRVSNYLSQLFPSDIVKLQILRDGKKMMVDVSVWVNSPLVPSILLQRREKLTLPSTSTSYHDNDTETSFVGVNPSYLMIGGLVFTVLTKEYIQSEFRIRDMTNFDAWANEFEILSMLKKPKAVANEEVVLLSQVIAHNCNIGYELHQNMMLLKFNGVSVSNIQHVKDMIDKIKMRVQDKDRVLQHDEKNLVFEFSTGRMVILDAMDAFAAEEVLCRDHGISSYASLDIL